MDFDEIFMRCQGVVKETNYYFFVRHLWNKDLYQHPRV